MTEQKFPIDVYPKTLVDIIQATMKTLGFHQDYIGASILLAAASAIGKTRKVHFKETWEGAAILFMILVGDPGVNKSHPLAFAIKPLLDLTEKIMTGFDEFDEDAEYEMFRTDIPEPDLDRIDYQIVLSNTTIEAMIQLLGMGVDRLLIYSDEISSFLKNMDRYGKSDNESYFLSLFSGTSFPHNRKTEKPPSFVKSPVISIGGTTQPEVLSAMFKKTVANGFFERFLYVFPAEVKVSRLTAEELEPWVVKSYNEIFDKLLKLRTVKRKPTVLKLAPEAFEAVLNWTNEKTEQANVEPDKFRKGLYAKQKIFLLRFALILELLEMACGVSTGESVGIRSVNGAKLLVEFFEENILRAVQSCSADPVEALPEKQAKVYRVLKDEFQTWEAIAIGAKCDVSERTIKYMLRNKELFKQVKTGHYKKVF